MHKQGRLLQIARHLISPETTVATKMSETPNFTLYTCATPNGQKASIALEELGLTYKVYEIKLDKVEQKEEWFLKINPNGRIPALVDHKRGDFPVFESGAILLYLAEHYDPNHIILPADANQRSTAIQWLMFQMGGVGPMQGQANHFHRYAPEKIPYAIKRYQGETHRLYTVLERGLSDGREYIAGPFSVADISLFGWVAGHGWSGVSLEGLPLLEKWLHRCASRPALVRGYKVPRDNHLIDKDFKVDEESAKTTVEKASSWIVQTQQQDQQNQQELKEKKMK